MIKGIIKCFLCGKRIKERIIPLGQAWSDKWDDDWGIERIYNGKIVIICLECYRKLSNFRW